MSIQPHLLVKKKKKLLTKDVVEHNDSSFGAINRLILDLEMISALISDIERWDKFFDEITISFNFDDVKALQENNDFLGHLVKFF